MYHDASHTLAPVGRITGRNASLGPRLRVPLNIPLGNAQGDARTQHARMATPSLLCALLEQLKRCRLHARYFQEHADSSPGCWTLGPCWSVHMSRGAHGDVLGTCRASRDVRCSPSHL